MEFGPILLLGTAGGLVACCFPADAHEQLSQGRPKRAKYRTNPATCGPQQGESRRRYEPDEVWRCRPEISSQRLASGTDTAAHEASEFRRCIVDHLYLSFHR